MQAYSADFETIVTSPTRVWLWGICPINDYKKVIWGKDIESFIEEIKKDKYNKCKIYFHNLKFDGTFICYYLLTHDYKVIEEGKLQPYNFKCTISALGQWYQIKIKFNRTTVTIQDSLKKLPFSVRTLAKAFNLEMSKGEIDYAKDRPEGYIPDYLEIDYLNRDIGIVAQCLNMQYNQGMVEMTAGAEALKEYKDLTGKFRDNFPLLSREMDSYCRRAYKGGWVYCNPIHQGKIINEEGQVFDVNSMYPWAMYYMPMPYGVPKFYLGEYEQDEDYPLYICHISADFSLKEGHFPSVQIKKGFRTLAREYIIDSEGFLDLYLTNVDLELLFINYNVYDVEYIDGYKFRSTKHAFRGYIDKWMKVKEENTGAMRTLAKLMLNSLYGKFAKNEDVTGRHPIIKEDRVVLAKNKEEISETNYVPVGCFITAWARWNIIRSALKCGERFCYADTDSLHVLGLDPIEGLEIHEKELGKWKQELVFKRAKYLHAKCYIEEYDEDGKTKLKVTVAGLPSNCHNQVTFDNFKEGATYHGKLLQKSVPGGVILETTDFTIKGVM